MVIQGDGKENQQVSRGSNGLAKGNKINNNQGVLNVGSEEYSSALSLE